MKKKTVHSMGESLEQDSRKIKLGELLTDRQLRKVRSLLDGCKTETERAAALKEYLALFRSQLEAKGVLPEYLAYVLIYLRMKGQI